MEKNRRTLLIIFIISVIIIIVGFCILRNSLGWGYRLARGETRLSILDGPEMYYPMAAGMLIYIVSGSVIMLLGGSSFLIVLYYFLKVYLPRQSSK